MKGYLKKLVSVILCSVLSLSLVACSSKAPETSESVDTGNSTENSATSPTPQATEPQATEPVTITFWHNYDESAGQVAVLNELISQFETENPDIKVDPLYLEWSALKSNVITGATTKQLPDVMRGDIGFVPQFQDLNVLVEMSALPNYQEVASTVLEGPNNSTKMGDKFYGLAANTNTKILFYNKKMLTDAGVQVPTTLDELWSASEKLSGDGKYGFVEAWTGVWNVGQYIWSNGGDVLSPDLKTAQGYINGPIAVETIQKLADLYQAKVLVGPSMDPGAMGDSDGWAAGTYAMEIDGPWRASIAKDANIDIGAAPLPKGKVASVGVLGGEDFMMFQTSDDAHQQAAWKFIQFMADKGAQIAMAKVGQMPVNKEALEDPETLAAMPLIPVFSESLQTARSRPVTPKWGEMEDIIATKVAEAITGQKPVQKALDEAANEIDALIAQ